MEFLRRNKLGRTGVEISIPDDPNKPIGSIVVNKSGAIGHIGYVTVRPDSRSCGYGEILVCAAEDWARQNGCDSITATLIPVPGSEEAVFRLFDSRGFELDRKSRSASKEL